MINYAKKEKKTDTNINDLLLIRDNFNNEMVTNAFKLNRNKSFRRLFNIYKEKDSFILPPV